MNIFIPTPLRSYTNENARVQASGSSLSALLDDLNHQFPGIRFRMINEQEQIRPHIKIFINQKQVRSLNIQLAENDEVVIICALSGG